MDVTRILAEIDAEIARLEKARAALTAIGASGVVAPTRRRGRPKGSKNAAKPAATKRKRNLSPEGRKRIAEAMKKRWADHRKKKESTSKKETGR